MKKTGNLKLVLCTLSLALLCLGSTPALAAEVKLDVPEAERNRMGIFLSNFTELGMYEVNLQTVGRDQLIHFGIWHNYDNNYRSRIASCPQPGCQNGSLVIDRDHVAESVRKYFGQNFNAHGDVLYDGQVVYRYDGRLYHFDGADGEAVVYARVKDVYRDDQGRLRMVGSLYYPENPQAGDIGSFEALAAPYRYADKDTWSIISLQARFN